MTNPCSVPPFIRRLIGEETPEQQRACQAHDDAYEAGVPGDEQARALADAEFLVGLLKAPMSWWKAEAYWREVRTAAKDHWGHPRSTWRWAEETPPPESP